MTSRRLIGLVLASLLLVPAGLTVVRAQDQTPFVTDEAKPGRFSDDYTFRYCIDPRDPAWEVDQAIAEAISGALLLESAPTVIEDTNVREPLDRLYTHLLSDCAIYFGFKLLPGAYPGWLTVTRPYYVTGYVLATRNPDWKSLADIPHDQALGPTMGTAADFRLIQYLNTLGDGERWPRYPQADDVTALRGVADGSLAAALVWGPSYTKLVAEHPEFAGMRTIALDPLPASEIPVGAVVLSQESFLRSSVDQAIDSLVADGTIAKILADRGVQATPPQ